MTPEPISSDGERHVPLEEIAPEVLRRGGSISFIATGGSMWPHVRHGDLLRSEPLPAGLTPKTGWIIVYLTPSGRLGVHRVLGLSADGTLRVRGDAVTGQSEQVERESVLGRVAARERRGRTTDLTGWLRVIEGRMIARGGVIRVMLERALRAIVRPFRGHAGNHQDLM